MKYILKSLFISVFILVNCQLGFTVNSKQVKEMCPPKLSGINASVSISGGIPTGFKAETSGISGGADLNWGNISSGTLNNAKTFVCNYNLGRTPITISKTLKDGYLWSCSNPIKKEWVCMGCPPHPFDKNKDFKISNDEFEKETNVKKKLRLIQFKNSNGYKCQNGTEDGYAPASR